MFAHSQLTPFFVGCLPPQCPSKFRISAVKRLSSNIFVRYVTQGAFCSQRQLCALFKM